MYINALINFYSNYNSDQVNKESSLTEQIFKIVKEVTGKDDVKELSIEKVESLMQSYKIALSHLSKLSKEYEWKTCLNELGFILYDKYNIECFNVLFKFISLFPESSFQEKLFQSAMNYLTWMQFVRDNSSWISYAYFLHMVSLMSWDTVFNLISNRVLYSFVLVGWYASLLSFIVSSVLNIKESSDWLKFNNQKLYPLMFFISIVINLYSFGKLIYS